LRVPQPRADDEVAELARTLDDMLGSLAASRAETEAALARQRQFVADASHELRTPLTSILANLELLADDLDGERGEAARSALRSKGQVVLTVADDGPGIPGELRERIFERFTRGDGDHGGSFGLGLSIVRAVAESHHGTVALAPGDGGARFVVTLPSRNP